MAVINQKIDTVKLLIDSGANVNYQGIKETTLFMYANTKVINTRNFSIFDCLQTNEAKIN